jgi:hypothetical protein
MPATHQACHSAATSRPVVITTQLVPVLFDNWAGAGVAEAPRTYSSKHVSATQYPLAQTQCNLTEGATQRHGDAATWRHGDAATLRQGNMAPRRRCDMAPWRHGDMTTLRQGNMAPRRRCDMATWRHGDTNQISPYGFAPVKGGNFHRSTSSAAAGACRSFHLPKYKNCDFSLRVKNLLALSRTRMAHTRRQDVVRQAIKFKLPAVERRPQSSLRGPDY